MAKLSMIQRELKRALEVKKYAKRRADLRSKVIDMTLDFDERMRAVESLQKLPRNSAEVRLRNRCALTGRSRGFYRKFGLGRNKLRELAMRGDIPGLVKASW
ncbi:MAG: 30S ribosomal protein S14 [Thiotrichales bacterium]